MSVPILTLDCERHIAVTHEPERATHSATTLTDAIARLLAAFLAVYREMGFGFAPALYVRALHAEFHTRGLAAHRDPSLTAYYRGQTIGSHTADFLVEQSIVVLVHSSPAIGETERAQLLNVLRCARVETGIVLNFGRRPDFAQVSYSLKSP